jgi:hypothetical protein
MRKLALGVLRLIQVRQAKPQTAKREANKLERVLNRKKDSGNDENGQSFTKSKAALQFDWDVPPWQFTSAMLLDARWMQYKTVSTTRTSFAFPFLFCR